MRGLRLVLPAGLLAAVLPGAGRAEDNASRRTVEKKIRYCKDCHGQPGQGFTGAYPVPRLAGQRAGFLESRIDSITEHRPRGINRAPAIRSACCIVPQAPPCEVLRSSPRLAGPMMELSWRKPRVKKIANAAYGATMLNADMVNCESWWQKLAYFCQKKLEKGRFLSSKTQVKYNLRFFVNAGTVHSGCGHSPAYEILSRNINALGRQS